MGILSDVGTFLVNLGVRHSATMLKDSKKYGRYSVRKMKDLDG